MSFTWTRINHTGPFFKVWVWASGTPSAPQEPLRGMGQLIPTLSGPSLSCYVNSGTCFGEFILSFAFITQSYLFFLAAQSHLHSAPLTPVPTLQGLPAAHILYTRKLYPSVLELYMQEEEMTTFNKVAESTNRREAWEQQHLTVNTSHLSAQGLFLFPSQFQAVS